jgi:hypothetical protein
LKANLNRTLNIVQLEIEELDALTLIEIRADNNLQIESFLGYSISTDQDCNNDYKNTSLYTMIESCGSLYDVQSDLDSPSTCNIDILGAKHDQLSEDHTDFELPKAASEQRISPKNYAWKILVKEMLYDTIPGNIEEGDDCLSILSFDSIEYYDRKGMLSFPIKILDRNKYCTDNTKELWSSTSPNRQLWE